MYLDDEVVDVDRRPDSEAHIGRHVEARGIECPGKHYLRNVTKTAYGGCALT